MRWLFIGGVILLVELFGYLTIKELLWLLGINKLNNPHRWRVLFWGLLACLNVCVVFAMSGIIPFGFRWLSYLLVVMLYAQFATVFAIIAHQLVKHIDKQSTKKATTKTNTVSKMVVGKMVAVASFVGLFWLSHHNAYTPVVKHLAIQIDKPLSQPLRVAMVSDLHLGNRVGVNELERLAQILKEQQADMLLIPGDIMDDDIVAYTKQNMQPALEQVVNSVPLGVFASLGNHDLYQDEAGISQAVRNAGIHLLVDEVMSLKLNEQDRIWLVGRYDDHHSDRANTQDLLAHTNVREPVILLDHRPTQVEQHQALPIDLQVSGHTHNGQIFPANLIVQAINRIGYGYEQIGQGHYLVSSGYGFWHLPLRLGSQSEVWIIDLTGLTELTGQPQ